jgi:hypothetical protein
MVMANTLAYYDMAASKAVKGFIAQASGDNLINHLHFQVTVIVRLTSATTTCML